MKCVICHGEEVRAARVFEEIHSHDDIVRIPLEIPVCTECGERYYDRAKMRRLEQIRERLKSGDIALKEIGKVLICEG